MADITNMWNSWKALLNGTADWPTVIGPSAISAFSPKIRVKTEDLVRKADQVDGLLNELSRDFGELAQIIQRSSSYWIGDAGNRYRADYKKQDDEIQDVIRRLRRFPNNLRQIAGVYKAGEEQAKATAAALPKDIL